MTKTNSSILRGFVDEVINQRRLDLLPKYLSQEYVGHGTPYVGLGIAPDYSLTITHISLWVRGQGRDVVY